MNNINLTFPAFNAVNSATQSFVLAKNDKYNALKRELDGIHADLHANSLFSMPPSSIEIVLEKGGFEQVHCGRSAKNTVFEEGGTHLIKPLSGYRGSTRLQVSGQIVPTVYKNRG
jgi:hypothetical protein